MRIHRFLRRIDADDLMELFMVSAIAAILIIRSFLELTDYPRFGDSVGLHIAHMLWGGLLMLVSIAILIAFLDRAPRRLAALLGGVGFGAFIDEVGKFVTQDNDYFFQPSIAIIYFVFILLYLVMRMLQEKGLSSEEYIANAMDLAKEAVARNMDAHEKAMTLELLREASRSHAAQALRRFLATVVPKEERAPSLIVRCETRVREEYRALIRSPWFEVLILAFFVLGAIGKLVLVPRVLAGSGLPILWSGAFIIMLLIARDGHLAKKNRRAALSGLAACAFALLLVSSADDISIPRIGISAWGELVSTMLVALAVIVGAYNLRASRLGAYLWFKRAALLAIFLTQFFLFYRLQFLALPSLIANLIVLGALEYGIREEERIQRLGVRIKK